MTNKTKTVNFHEMMKNLNSKQFDPVEKEYLESTKKKQCISDLGFDGVLVKSFFFKNKPISVKKSG